MEIRAFYSQERLYKIEFDPTGSIVEDFVDWCYVKNKGVREIRIGEISRIRQ